MEIYIRNMVCDRCIRAVENIFHRASIDVDSVQLGVVRTENNLTAVQQDVIKQQLKAEGFEWLDDKRTQLVNEIKLLILALVRDAQLDEQKEKLSQYLSAALHKEYHYLSNTFSAVENTTIEQYFILQKIEKVKEWLVYDELTLSEMAFRLGYSSVAHLSGQFKRVTGFTPREFKKLKDHHRKPLDGV